MNVIINFKTDQKTKQRAQKIAGDLGMSLSGVINAYLHQFIRLQTVFVSNKYDEPSDLLLAAFNEAQEDKKQGKVYSFKKPKEAIDFVDKIIAKKKR